MDDDCFLNKGVLLPLSSGVVPDPAGDTGTGELLLDRSGVPMEAKRARAVAKSPHAVSILECRP